MVNSVLTVRFSHSRCPSGNRISSIRMGHAAVGASSKVKLCSSLTLHLRAASPALSARDSTIPASYAFAIEGRTHGHESTGRGHPLHTRHNPPAGKRAIKRCAVLVDTINAPGDTL